MSPPELVQVETEGAAERLHVYVGDLGLLAVVARQREDLSGVVAQLPVRSTQWRLCLNAELEQDSLDVAESSRQEGPGVALGGANGGVRVDFL